MAGRPRGVLLLVGVAAVILGSACAVPALLVETARPAAAAVVILLACFGSGALACRLTARTPISIAESLAVGFAVFGTLVAIVAAIGVALGPAVLALTAIAAIAGIVVAVRERPAVSRSWLLLLLVPPVAIAFVEAITPVNSPDELVYKLAIPHAYVLYGRMLAMPWSSHSFLAMSLHLTDVAALILGGGIAAKLAHFGLYIAALCVVHAAVARIEERAAVVATGVLAWTPALATIAGWAWDEWGVIALVVIALDRWQRWRTEGEAAHAMIAAVAVGCAVSVKYTALPFVAALAVIVLWQSRREWRLIAKCGVVAGVFGAFFYVRNAIWSGSPIAPMLLPGAPPLSHYRAAGFIRAWADFFSGVYVFDRSIIDESLGLFVPAVAVIALLAAWRRERTLRDWTLVSALQLPVVVSMAPVTRNLIPALVPAALAGSVMAWRWIAIRRPLVRAVGAIAIAAALVAQIVIVVVVMRSYDFLPYLTGRESPPAYIAAQHAFTRPYAWINLNTPGTARVLLLGENRTFYLDRRFVAASNFDGPRIAAWLGQAQTPDALAQMLRREGVSIVLIHKPWYRVGAQPASGLEREWILAVPPQVHRTLLQFLASHCVIRERDEQYLVYEVVR